MEQPEEKLVRARKSGGMHSLELSPSELYQVRL